MKASMFMLLLLCICTAVLLTLGLYTQHRQDGEQAQAFAAMAERAQMLEAQIAEMRKDQAKLQQSLLEQHQERVSPPPVASAEPAGKVTPVIQQPFLAKAFLGRDYVGIAQVNPVYRQTTNDGEMIYEYVVNLSGDARDAVTVNVTNIVEREVYRSNTLNNNYAQPYYYGYGYPAWIRRPNTNHFGNPSNPGVTPPIAMPPSTPIPPGGSPWTPVTAPAGMPPQNTASKRSPNLSPFSMAP